MTDAAGKLRELNVIPYSRGKITVLERQHLEALCCECCAVVRKETDRIHELTRYKPIKKADHR